MWMQPPNPPPSAAQPAPPPKDSAPKDPAAKDSTPLSGIEVIAPSGTPKVVATYPAAGAAIAPGNVVVMVRFDHRMRPEVWGYGPPAGLPCLEKPRLLKDEKTFVLLCTAGFNKSFTLTLNGEGKGFADLSNTAAAPFTLAFTTTGGDPTLTLTDALKAAGLAPVDSPILTTDPATAPHGGV